MFLSYLHVQGNPLTVTKVLPHRHHQCTCDPLGDVLVVVELLVTVKVKEVLQTVTTAGLA